MDNFSKTKVGLLKDKTKSYLFNFQDVFDLSKNYLLL